MRGDGKLHAATGKTHKPSSDKDLRGADLLERDAVPVLGVTSTQGEAALELGVPLAEAREAMN